MLHGMLFKTVSRAKKKYLVFKQPQPHTYPIDSEKVIILFYFHYTLIFIAKTQLNHSTVLDISTDNETTMICRFLNWSGHLLDH